MARILVVMFLLLGALKTSSAQSVTSFETYGDTVRSNSEALVSGDFNNDGKPDLLQCCNAGGHMVVRFGNGDGTFQLPVSAFPMPVGLYSAVAADLNGDHNLDLIAVAALNPPEPPAPASASLMVWLGNGDGTFRSPQSYTTTNEPGTVMLGNFFGSSQQDVAVSEGNSTIDIFQSEGNGNYAFRNSLSVVSGVLSVMSAAVGDLNGNGISDLAVMELAGTSHGIDFAQPQQLYILWNDGQGNFTQQKIGGDYHFPTISTARVHGAAQVDVLVSYACTGNNGICVGVDAYSGPGNNTVTKRTLVTSVTGANPGDIYSLQGVDINGDGYSDLVAFGDMLQATSSNWSLSGVSVWHGNADGTFEQTPQILLTSNEGQVGSVAAADFNRDGRMDFAEASPGTGGTTEYYINASHSQGCNAYTTTRNVTVCQPVDNTFSTTNLNVMASSNDTNAQVTQMQVYIDGSLKFSQAVTTFAQNFTVNPGPHLVATKGWDATGANFMTVRNITAYDGTPGLVCAAGPREAHLCVSANPASGAPITIVGSGNTDSNVATAAQLYIDGQLVVNNLSQCDQNNDCYATNSALITSQQLSAGTHFLVFKVWDTAGNVYDAGQSVVVH